MCSRFWGAPDGQRVLSAIEKYGVEMPSQALLGPRKQDTRPTDTVLAVRPGSTKSEMIEINSWGFTIPGSNQLFINGKIETILERRLFAESARQRRCLIPGEFFIEWQGPKGDKVPMAFRLKDRGLLWMAGLWREVSDHWTQCVILTTEPNALVAEVHNRMPVLVPDEHINRWLKGKPEAAVAACTAPLPAALMTVEVATLDMVNKHGGGRQGNLFG